MPSRYLVGIDLGTTNTACAYVDTRAGRRHPRLRRAAARRAGPGRAPPDAAVVRLPRRRARRARGEPRPAVGGRTATSASAGWRASRARAFPAGWSRRRSRGSATAASIARRRSCRGAAATTWPRSRRSTRRRASWPPARRLGRELPGAAGGAGRRAHGARVVRRGGARADARGGARRRPAGGRAARGAAGGVLRLAGRARARLAQRVSAPCRSCWWSTSAAAPPTSRSSPRARDAASWRSSASRSASTCCSAATTWTSRWRARSRRASFPAASSTPTRFHGLVSQCRDREGGAPGDPDRRGRPHHRGRPRRRRGRRRAQRRPRARRRRADGARRLLPRRAGATHARGAPGGRAARVGPAVRGRRRDHAPRRRLPRAPARGRGAGRSARWSGPTRCSSTAAPASRRRCATRIAERDRLVARAGRRLAARGPRQRVAAARRGARRGVLRARAARPRRAHRQRRGTQLLPRVSATTTRALPRAARHGGGRDRRSSRDTTSSCSRTVRSRSRSSPRPIAAASTPGDLVTLGARGASRRCRPSAPCCASAASSRSARCPCSSKSQLTEIGTLALWCRSRTTEHRWRLEFRLRDTVGAEAPPPRGGGRAGRRSPTASTSATRCCAGAFEGADDPVTLDAPARGRARRRPRRVAAAGDPRAVGRALERSSRRAAAARSTRRAG